VADDDAGFQIAARYAGAALSGVGGVFSREHSVFPRGSAETPARGASVVRAAGPRRLLSGTCRRQSRQFLTAGGGEVPLTGQTDGLEC
jgi:hypothetical protein